MKIFGIAMVRDEADIVELTLRHHLALGLDHVLVVDNGSRDGTDRILERLARREPRLGFRRDPGPFRPGDLATELAREASSRGADWVVGFDADEFWHAPGGDMRRVLAESDAVALEVSLVNFVQRRSQHGPAREALLHMTRRTARPIGPVDICEELVGARQIAFVEIAYPTKWACRASPQMVFAPGYHGVSGPDGPRRRTEDLLILHAPLRSRAALLAKAEHGRRVEEAGYEGRDSWHVRRFRRLAATGAADAEWAANSYDEDGLDVYGSRHELVFDPRLRDAVAGQLRAPWWRRLSFAR